MLEKDNGKSASTENERLTNEKEAITPTNPDAISVYCDTEQCRYYRSRNCNLLDPTTGDTVHSIDAEAQCRDFRPIVELVPSSGGSRRGMSRHLRSVTGAMTIFLVVWLVVDGKLGFWMRTAHGYSRHTENQLLAEIEKDKFFMVQQQRHINAHRARLYGIVDKNDPTSIDEFVALNDHMTADQQAVAAARTRIAANKRALESLGAH